MVRRFAILVLILAGGLSTTRNAWGQERLGSTRDFTIFEQSSCLRTERTSTGVIEAFLNVEDAGRGGTSHQSHFPTRYIDHPAKDVTVN